MSIFTKNVIASNFQHRLVPLNLLRLYLWNESLLLKVAAYVIQGWMRLRKLPLMWLWWGQMESNRRKNTALLHQSISQNYINQYWWTLSVWLGSKIRQKSEPPVWWNLPPIPPADPLLWSQKAGPIESDWKMVKEHDSAQWELDVLCRPIRRCLSESAMKLTDNY